jgi:DNA-directed RNA polymerase subunit RPC12/RpoP
VKPTTGPVTVKLYRCKRCGHEQEISTNHYGECYSAGHYNACPACPPWAKYPEYGGSTIWICAAPCPPEMDKPANWKTATVTLKRDPRRPHEVRGSAASNACLGAL